MTSLEVIDTDAFLDMPLSSQVLYFHLNARADDDGFIANPKKIVRMLGANTDDFKLLVTKKFIIYFEDGVCIIKHWRINNFIRKDIYKETKYLDLKNTLFIRRNGAYTQTDDGRAIPIPKGHFQLNNDSVNDLLTSRQLSIGKVRKDKVSKGKKRKGKKRTEKSSDSLEYTKDFLSFWKAYPRKVGKGEAFKAWKKAKLPALTSIVEAVETQKESKQWKKEDGRFIPNPATWLNQRRWEDELQELNNEYKKYDS